jgi:hypothetical protein
MERWLETSHRCAGIRGNCGEWRVESDNKVMYLRVAGGVEGANNGGTFRIHVEMWPERGAAV